MGSNALLRCLLFLAHVALFWTLAGVWVYDRWFGNVQSISALDPWPLNLWQSIAVVAVIGFLWAFDPQVDTRLGFGLFPAAVAAALVAGPPAVLAFLAAIVVAVGDLVYNLYRAFRERDFDLGRLIPIITPFRHRGRF